MRKILSLSVIMLSIGLILSACGASVTTPTPTKNTVNLPNVQTGKNPTDTVPAAGYPAQSGTPGQSAYPAMTAQLKVTKTDGTSMDIDSTTLANMPSSVVKVGSTNYTGIALPDLLAKAGINDFSKITLSSSSSSQVLTKDQVNSKAILSTSPDGTLQLVSPDLPDANWLKAVNSIKAE